MIERVEVYKDGELVEVQEVELPDPPAGPLSSDSSTVAITPEAVNQLITEMDSVSTQSAKLNALKRFFESLAEGGTDGG